ncbi:hypothetical protein D3C85_1370700 [compost metagenome]
MIQKILEVRRYSKTIHPASFRAYIINLYASAVRDQIIVGRSDIELTSNPIVRRDHRLGGGDKFSPSTIVINAYGRLRRNHFLLYDLANLSVAIETDIGPLGVTRGHGHDEAVGRTHLCEVVVDGTIYILIAIGDHHLIVVVNQILGMENSAGRPLGDLVQRDDLATRRPSAQQGLKIVTVQVLRLTDEHEPVRDGWR